MFQRKRIRNLDCTLLLDVQLTSVKSTQRSVLDRDVSASAVPAGAGVASYTKGITKDETAFPAVLGLLYIKTPFPVLLRAGDLTFMIENLFCVNGTFPEYTLTSVDQDTIVSIHQY